MTKSTGTQPAPSRDSAANDDPEMAVLIPGKNQAAATAKVVKDLREALPAAAVYVYENNSTGWSAGEAGSRDRKLIIQIPCLNEEETLPVTLAALPRHVPGFARVEWQIIDDGSTDRTVEVARANGADHIVRLPRHGGLAAAFRAGISAALARGADVIVNTDADNQYNADDIPALVAPILAGKADLVVGCRPIEQIEHFSATKKFLQKLGSWVVRVASGTNIPDAPSGFRAISREAAMRMTVVSRYTYTLETLIQAGQSGLAVTWVPVRVNGQTRPSRLMKGIPGYVWHSLLTILRFFLHYRAFKFLSVLGLIVALPGIAIGMRFVYFFALGEGDGHVQSLILSALLIGMGVVFAITGLIADLINVNRRLMEDMRYRMMRHGMLWPETGHAGERPARGRPEPVVQDQSLDRAASGS